MSPTSTHSPPAFAPPHESPKKKLLEAISPHLPIRRRSTQHGEPSDTSFNHQGANRQDTLQSQDSQASQKSHISAPGRRQAAYVSSLSLPEYRIHKPAFYWPRNGGIGPLVHSSEAENNPDEEQQHRHCINGTLKSEIFSVVLLKDDGREEHVALKLVWCGGSFGTPEFEEKYNQEYRILAGLEHNHIIATVGSFVEGEPGDLKYGLLLFPLARWNLDDIMKRVSKNNEERVSGGTGWKVHGWAGNLLNYFACLCRAVLYLHSQESPCRHNDIKPQNILIDKSKTVLLADFDIAKKYTNRLMASTSSVTMRTDLYAPDTVKDGKERSFDWDIFSLGCVFLEMATVAFGETLETMRTHMCGHEGAQCEYSVALKLGTLFSWIQHLKDVAKSTPGHLPIERFQNPEDNRTSQTDISVEIFLDMISVMLKVKVKDNHTEILNTAWQCFNRFASRNCPDCYPKDADQGNSTDRLAPPKPSRTGQARLPTIESGSDGSSDGIVKDASERGGELTGPEKERKATHDAAKAVADKKRKEYRVLVRDTELLRQQLLELEAQIVDCDSDLREADDQEPKAPQTHEDSCPPQDDLLAFTSPPSEVTANGHDITAPQLDRENIVPTTEYQPESSVRDIVTPRVLHQSREFIFDSSLNLARSMSAPEITLSPYRDNDQSNEDADSLPLRYKYLGEAAHTSPKSPTSATRYDEFRNRHNDECGVARRSGTHTSDSQISDESHVAADNGRQLVLYQPTEPLEYADTSPPIKQSCIRVLTFTPQERIGVSCRQPAAIRNTRLLIYKNGQVTVESSPDNPNQQFLDGVFFDVPASCNVWYRIPTSRGAGGELFNLRDVLSYRDRWSCFIGMPRIRLMYVPGHYTDAALEDCFRFS